MHSTLYKFYITFAFHFPAANTVSFSQSVFDADEENEIVQIVLVLSGSLSNNIIVQVVSSNINATGM